MIGQWLLLSIVLVLAWGAGIVVYLTRPRPMSPWQRYAEDRSQGTRVPPSASHWTAADRQRQAEAQRRITEGADR